MAKKQKRSKAEELKIGSDGYYFDYVYDDNGKEYKVRGKTPLSLYTNMVKKENDLKNGIKILSKNTTFKTWASEYMETYKRSSVGVTYYSSCLGHLKNHIYPSIGHMKLKDIKPLHLQKMINILEGKSYSLVNTIYSLTREIFKSARINQLIIVDPAELLQLPKNKKGQRRSITDLERKHILKVAEKHRAGMWIKMMLYCGLRPGETEVLLWKDIDFKKSRVTVSKSLEIKTNKIKGPKTVAGIREVPIPKDYLEELRKIKGDPFEYVFQARHGKHHTKFTVQYMWDDFKEQLNLSMGAKTSDEGIALELIVADDLVPYCLRHTFCTDLQAAGVPINVAKELMGHEDIQTTSKIYTHKSEEAFLNAADKINAYHDKKNKKGDDKSDDKNRAIE